MPTTIDIEQAVGQMLASGAAVKDITDEAAFGDLAFRLHAVRTLRALLKSWDDQLTVAMSDTMDEDRVTVEHIGTIVREPHASKATWSREEARTAIRDKILSEVALDPSTGEIRGDWRGVASRTIQAMGQAYSCLDPLVGGLRHLGIDATHLRSFEPQPGFDIKILENLP